MKPLTPTARQVPFLASAADLTFFGGAAGGGKTFGLLADPLRWVGYPNFRGVLFRRTYPELKKGGGLLDETRDLYGRFATLTDMTWTFPSGATVELSHMQHEKDADSWRGGQLSWVGFDQAETFSRRQFFYLVGRLRTKAAMRPRAKASCNAEPGWVAELLAPWIGTDGYADPEMADKRLRFTRRGDSFAFDEVFGDLSLRFCPAKLTDNPHVDPRYEMFLESQSLVDRERLLHGNWKIRATAGNVFDRAWFNSVSALPADASWIRSWDFSSGTGKARTAGVKVGISGGRVYVADVKVGLWSPAEREKLLLQTARADGPDVPIILEQEPGSSGSDVAKSYVTLLAGFDARAKTATGKKPRRWAPLSAQAEVGNVFYLLADWNEDWLNEMHNASEDGKTLLDQVDATAQGFNELSVVDPFAASWGGVA